MTLKKEYSEQSEFLSAVPSHVYERDGPFQYFVVDCFSNPPPGCASAGALLQATVSKVFIVMKWPRNNYKSELTVSSLKLAIRIESNVADF